MVRTMAREFLENEVEPLVVDAFHEEKLLGLEKIAPKMLKGDVGFKTTWEYRG
jgi:hypothetical protein